MEALDDVDTPGTVALEPIMELATIAELDGAVRTTVEVELKADWDWLNEDTVLTTALNVAELEPTADA